MVSSELVVDKHQSLNQKGDDDHDNEEMDAGA